MNKIIKSLLAASIFATFSLNAMAADLAPAASMPERMERMKAMNPEERTKERELMHKEMQSLSPEQRAEKHKEMHEHMMKMTPEERAKNHEEMRKNWDSMTPEQRTERRKEMH